MGTSKRFTEEPVEVTLWEDLPESIRENPCEFLHGNKRSLFKSIQKEVFGEQDNRPFVGFYDPK